MKTLVKFSFLFLIIILQSCHKDDIYEGIIVQELDMGRCFPPFGNEPDEYIITNDSLYQALLTIEKPICDNYTLPNVDFTTYTLLGKFTYSDGSPKYYKREVIKDEGNMIYIYNIYMKCKNNNKEAISMNWVLVPKLPTGYSVKFNVEKD